MMHSALPLYSGESRRISGMNLMNYHLQSDRIIDDVYFESCCHQVPAFGACSSSRPAVITAIQIANGPKKYLCGVEYNVPII